MEPSHPDRFTEKHLRSTQKLARAWRADQAKRVIRLNALALRPRPEGNGCAERFIRTLKENLLWVRTFRTVEELRLALIEFRQTYNEHWLIERHRHRSPAQFRRDQMDKLPLIAQSQSDVPGTGGGTAEYYRLDRIEQAVIGPSRGAPRPAGLHRRLCQGIPQGTERETADARRDRAKLERDVSLARSTLDRLIHLYTSGVLDGADADRGGTPSGRHTAVLTFRRHAAPIARGS